MRKSVYLVAAAVLSAAVLAAAVAACGGDSTAGATTTLETGGTTTAVPGTTTTGAETTTSAVDESSTSPSDAGDTTTSVAEDTTSTSEETTTTTEAARTTDTADHAADFRAQYPSSESFTNSTWMIVDAAPGSHLGAAVDVTGQPTNVTVDPDSRYLTWELTIAGPGGEQMKALCRTNVDIDRSLLSGGSTVEVRGIIVGAQSSDAGGGAIIYVESLQKAA